MFPPQMQPGTPPLDGPPPSPTAMGGTPPGGPLAMQGLAPPPGVPSTGMPTEVNTGASQSVDTMIQMVVALIQVSPDQAPLLQAVQQLLSQYQASLKVAGAQPSSPTATGPAFPGGGIDRGIAGPGAV